MRAISLANARTGIVPFYGRKATLSQFTSGVCQERWPPPHRLGACLATKEVRGERHGPGEL